MSHGIYQLNPDANHLSQLSVVTMPAMSNRVGGVMQGAGVSIDTTGLLTLAPATSNVVGGVKQGNNVTIAADGTISVAAPGTGTVTSVGLTVPAEFSVAGSPVTGSGTLAVTKANENANTVWAGPSSGAAAAPTFRGLVAADVPVLTKVNGSALAVNIDNFSDTTPAAPSGFGNIKFQSDASGNISAYDPIGSWHSWTPSFNFQTMTGTPTVRYARWIRQGPIGYAEINFQVTFGGSAASYFTVSAPVDPIETNFQSLAACFGTGPTVLAPCAGLIQSQSGAGNFVFSQLNPFTLGTALVFILNGSFRIGA